ncbi:hypothetical protein BC629DRAFT_1539411 [Irpex lacteus]|nr:hypothetical protein BC629DRAFT_1539411 [Irpex lacteus]
MIDGVPVIAMTETSPVLTFILHLYYPPYGVSHSLDSMDDAFAAMEAVRKYMMPHAQKVVAKHFELFAEKDSIRVYAVACKKRLQDEMKIAARASLYTPLVHKTIPEMADITGADYCNLLEYRQACSVAAAQSMPDTWEREFLWSRTMTRSFFRRNLLECKGTSSSKDVRSKSVPTSFNQYISKALDILATRPHSKVIFDAPLSNLLQSSSKDWFDKAENLADNLVSFQKHFAAAVDEAISAIPLSKFQRISGALTQTT